MKYVVVCVRDIIGDLFGQPYFMPSEGMAIRNFADAVNDTKNEQNVMAKHPADFELYKLGMFDDANAAFELLSRPEQLTAGKQVVLKSNS